MALSSASGKVRCSPNSMKKNPAELFCMELRNVANIYTEPPGPRLSPLENCLLRRSKGFRTKSRTLISRKPRDRGKQPLGRLLIGYTPGQMVRIMINPAVQKGMPHRRYPGRVGTVAEKRGRSYVVEVSGRKTPRLIIRSPEHITPVEESS